MKAAPRALALAALLLLPLAAVGSEAVGEAVEKTAAEASPAPAGKVAVEEAQFGLFPVFSGGEESFVPADRVPNKPGQAYGWVLRVKTDKKAVRWREEFVLPAAPAHWGADAPQAPYTLSPDRKVSVTERTEEPKDGMLMNLWSVAPGDPSGPHVMRVYVEGEQVRTFGFTVE